MKIVVIGGTGLIGSQLVQFLQKSENQVVAASPNTGVNSITGEGLDAALEGTEVLVDVSNSPSFADDDVYNFFKISTENLIAASKKSGVKHIIILSVVGTQKLQESGYFRAKQLQEDLLKNSGIPFTIVHATQFFEFAGGIAHTSNQDGKVHLSTAFIQPISSRDVASFLAKITQSEPKNDIVEIEGAEKFRMNEWISNYAKKTNKNLEIVADENALYYGAALSEDTLIAKNPVFTSDVLYEDWISVAENQR